MNKKMTWLEWYTIARKLYLACFHGWPRAEMRKYFIQGMTPEAAVEAAASRRKGAV